ncbi:ubiquitin carboxyl-terminal hydrolase 23 isoform X2 [Andrographis paniculata]|nr:ubiquitin carboxyl-terminal hydrolase 23 isoform X2 [Andrographis paniculata]
MVNLLESMHKCCIPSGVPSESPSAYEKSLVHKIFGGRLRSQVQCMQCSFCSNKFDPFLDISLEILKAETLEKALHHFTAKEQLDGGAKQYQCQQCKQKVKALKHLTIHKAPLVLTVHLKRFGHFHGQKITKKIAFGSTLDLKPFVSGPYEGDLNYTLYGVLVHAGWSTHSGHYYCFVRTSSGMWYSLDDNQVVQVNERKVLEQKAYMLFYVRNRKHFCRKKPVDSIQKENIIINAIGKSAYSKISRDSNEKVQNGSTEKNIDALTTASSSLRDEQVNPVPKEIPSVKTSLLNGNGNKTLNPLEYEGGSQSKPSSAIQDKHPEKGPHAPSMNNVGQKEEWSSTIAVSRVGTGSKIDSHNTGSVVENQNSSAAVVSSNCIVPKDSNHRKYSTGCAAMLSTSSKDRAEEIPMEPADKLLSSRSLSASTGDTYTTNRMCDSKTMPLGANMEAWDQVTRAKLSIQNHAADNLVGGVRQKIDDSVIEETNELKVTMKKKNRPQLIVKRKPFKCRAVTMLLSSNIMFGAALSTRKKISKSRKTHSIQKTPHDMKQISEDDFPSSPEQSRSDKSSPLPTNQLECKKKKVKHSSDHQHQKLRKTGLSCDSSIPIDAFNNDFKERVVLDSATLAANNQPGPDFPGECRRESRQNDVMSMLTRGIEEAIVARWDDIEISATERTEIGAAQTTQIGYIGDEWDEEYDKGKQKKVRMSKTSFDGPNLFQEIASRNTKRKRKDRTSLENPNPPFRI